MSEISLPIAIIEDQTQDITQEPSDKRKWLGLGILSLGLAVVIIDTTLLNVSLSYLLHDLKTDIKSLQWVITSYTLILAAFTITGGRLGDLFGRKKMFMAGAIIFAIGSFIASSSHSLHTLLLGESIIEGFGAALMMPATSSLVVVNFKGKERAMAFGIWGAVAGASSAIGPLLGGWLASHYSWRWGFRINIFVALVVVLGAIWLIKEAKSDKKPHLDFVGVILSSLGLLGITYGIIESSTYGWLKAKHVWEFFGHQLHTGNVSITPIAMAIGLVFLIAFALWEDHTEKQGNVPLVSLSLLKNRVFTAGTITVSILTLGMTGTFFALPIFLQAVKGMDAFKTGLTFLPLSLGLLIVAPLSGFFSRKIPAKYLIQIGLVVDIIAALVIRSTISVDIPTSHILFGLGLYGVGMGLVMAPISNITLSAAPQEQSGEASGVNNTMRQVGATLGSAIVGAAVITVLSTSLSLNIQKSTVLPQQIKTSIISVLDKDETAAAFGGFITPAGTPVEITQEIKKLANEATAKATQDGFIYSAMFAGLALAASFFLPKEKKEGEHASEEQSGNTKKIYALAAVIAIFSLGSGIWLLQRNSDSNKTTSTESIQNIQNAFLPTTSTPPTSQGQLPTTQTGATASRKTLRGEKVLGATTPLTETTYSNTALGFSLVLPSNWQFTASQNQTILFTSSEGKNASIQMYTMTANSLTDIKQILSSNSSAKNIIETTFQNLPAISFTSNGQQGIAVIKNNRLYYIMAQNISAKPISSLILF